MSGLLFLAGDVLRYLAFQIGNHHMHVNHALLSEPVAAAYRLVVGFPRIVQTTERHSSAVLPVQTERCHGTLRDQHRNVPISEVKERLGLVFRRHGAFHIHTAGDKPVQHVRLVVQSSPDNPLFARLVIDKIDATVHTVNKRFLTDSRTPADATKVSCEQLAFRDAAVIGDNINGLIQSGQLISRIITANIGRLAQCDGPLRHPPHHRLNRVTFQTPNIPVMHEIRGKHLHTGGVSKELGLIA